MLKRNIQSTGGSSFLITLPKDWVIRNRFKSQSALNVYQTNNNFLVVTGENTQKVKTIVIYVDEIPDKHLKREIISYFVSGYDEIILKSKSFFNANKRRYVREVSYILVGFDVFEDEANIIRLKEVSLNNTSSDLYINKVMKIIISMFDDLIKVLETNDMDLAEDIVLRDDEVDRINLYIMRKCLKDISNFGIDLPMYLPLQKIYFYEHVSIRLERIADHIIKMVSSVLQISHVSKFTFSVDEEKKISETKWYLKLCQNMLLTNNKDLAYKILDTHDAAGENKFVNRKIINKQSINITIDERIRRINSYVVNIAEEMMNIFPSFTS